MRVREYCVITALPVHRAYAGAAPCLRRHSPVFAQASAEWAGVHATEEREHSIHIIFRGDWESVVKGAAQNSRT